ncbi:MAG: hypothetical protein KAU24_03940 [Candidatus Aenigmarchaeota archaeon]|nr:hypothetical protein [Candidatus Aenigmarchaeota archaeon]
MSKLPKGGLVKKTNVLINVPERYQDSIFNAIEGSNQKIGLYGNYDCVMSAWPVKMDSKTYKSIWTFCEESDEEEAMDMLMGATPETAKKPDIDLFDGRVFMLEKYDPKVGGYIPRKKGRIINVVIDAPWGDRGAIRSYIIKESGKEIGVYKGIGHMTTWPSEGYYRPLPGSKPRRGKEGEMENVKYLKIWTFYEPEHEEIVVKKLRKTAKTYELPVMSFFDNSYFLFRYIKDVPGGHGLKFRRWNVTE